MLSNDEFCSELEQRIKDAYADSGNHLGWRLLTSPRSVLEGADVAFIGLNPGGKVEPPDHPKFAMPCGHSAYVCEKWESDRQGEARLQKQARALFQGLSVKPEQVLAGNLVPFQSLKNPACSLRLGEAVWTDILKRARPRLVIGMGEPVLKSLTRILKINRRDIEEIGVNWGKVKARKAAFPEGGSFVCLPHLSTFRIVTKLESQGALRSLFGDRWQA